MAQGDKLYLADKASVDAVGTKVDGVKTVVDNTKIVLDSTKSSVETTKSTASTINTTVSSISSKVGATSDASGTSTLFSYLKNILNKLTTLQSSSTSIPSTPVSKLKTGDVNIVSGGTTTVFESQSSGYLYSVMAGGSGTTNNARLTVQLDGQTILNMLCTFDSTYCGGFLVGLRPMSTGYLMGSGLKTLFTQTVLQLKDAEQSPGCAYSPIPLRVTSSLVIKLENTSGKVIPVSYTFIED